MSEPAKPDRPTRSPPSAVSDPSPSRSASLTGAGSSPSPLSPRASSSTPTSVGASPASTRARPSVTRSEATDHRHGFASAAGELAGSPVPAGGVPPFGARAATSSGSPPRGRTKTDAPASSTLATAARCASRSRGSTLTAKCFHFRAGSSTPGTRTATSSRVTVPRTSWRPPVAKRCTTEAPSSPASSRQPTFGT